MAHAQKSTQKGHLRHCASSHWSINTDTEWHEKYICVAKYQTWYKDQCVDLSRARVGLEWILLWFTVRVRLSQPLQLLAVLQDGDKSKSQSKHDGLKSDSSKLKSGWTGHFSLFRLISCFYQLCCWRRGICKRLNWLTTKTKLSQH